MRVQRVITTAVASAAAVATGVTGLAGPATAGRATARPASAHSYTAEDPAHDVVRLTDDQPDGPGTPAPHRAMGDLVSMRASYADGAVSVTLRYAALVPPRTKQDLALAIVSLRTDRGRTADAELVTSRTRPRRQLDWNSRDDTTCRGLKATVSYADARVRFTVPASCLHDPEWVRVGGGAGTLRGRTVYADDVQKPGAVSANLVLGPRIHQG